MANEASAPGLFLNRILGLDRPTVSRSPQSPKGSRNLGRKPRESTDGPAPALRADTVVGQLLRGLPVRSFRVLCEAFQLPRDRMADAVGIAPRTLARRNIFKPDESERIFRFGRIFQDAVDLFDGDETEARAWMLRPQFGLGGAVPLAFARTELGAQEVRRLIARLNEGIFA